MALLPRQKITETIVTPTFNNADTGSGDTVSNKDGKTFLYFKNPGASSATATITAVGTSKEVAGYGPLTKVDLAVSVNAGEEKVVGPFPNSAWNDSSGILDIQYSGAGAADIDVAVFSI